jgi:hypothetical protein
VRPAWLRRFLDGLPESSLVLDVGGWAEPDPRADWVIDLGPYETRNWYQTLGAEIGGGPERFTKETWVQRDICGAEPWPFEDDQFDYVICSQTLEDVRDPIRVCGEMARVAKAGYVETPAAAIELTRGIESPLWCGWRHHRWLVEVDDGGLLFRGKPHHIHNPFFPSIPSPRFLLPAATQPLEFSWEGSFHAAEVIEVESDVADASLRSIIERSSRPDRAADLRRSAGRSAWLGYRSARRALGRLLLR